jgi:hypothetical protein
MQFCNTFRSENLKPLAERGAGATFNPFVPTISSFDTSVKAQAPQSRSKNRGLSRATDLILQICKIPNLEIAAAANIEVQGEV